jgi:hypothetical protein
MAAGAIARSRGFDGLYGQDAYAYFDYGTASVRESLLHLTPLEPFFWPPGYPLLVALASLVLGPTALAGQLVSLLMGALVPALTVLLVHELWPDDLPLALLSGALVAVCGQLWQSSVVVMSDTTGLALATLSAVALVRYTKTCQAPWLLLASGAIAYATLTRWIYGLVAVPFAIYALIVLLEATRQWSHDARRPTSPTPIEPTPITEPSTSDPDRVAAAETRPVSPTSTAFAQARATLDASQESTSETVDTPFGPTCAPPSLDGDTREPSPSSVDGGYRPSDTCPNAPRSAAPTSAVIPRGAEAPTLSPRNAVLQAVAALLVAVLIVVPVVAEPMIGLIRYPAQPATFAGNFQVYSWSPLNALRHDFFTADGHLAYALPNGAYYGLAPANFAYFGPLLAVWILPGLWAARRWQVRTIVLIVGWGGVVLAFHSGAPWQNFRFALAYLPPAAILAAAGLLLAWRWLATRLADPSSVSDPRRLQADASPSQARHPAASPAPPETNARSSPRADRARAALRTLIAACIALGVLSTAADGARLVERFIDSKDQELALVHWVQSQTPTNAELLTFGPTLAFRHYANVPTYDLFDLDGPEVRAIVSDPAQHYLLVDLGSIESQWLNQSPSTNYHLLRDEVGLRELGTEGSYTLYEIDPPATRSTK